MTVIKPISVLRPLEKELPDMPRRDTSTASPPSTPASNLVTRQYLNGVLTRRNNEVDAEISRIDATFQRTEDAFEEADRRMIARFRRVDEHFEEVNERVDDGFKAIDAKFKHVDSRFARADARIDNVERRMDDVHSLLHNNHSYRPMDTVRPISLPVSSSTGSYRVPSNFPSTVGKLWRLQDIKNHGQLTSLIKAYDITEEWRTWGRFSSFLSDEDSMDDEPEEEPTSRYTDVAEAVTLHSRIAVRKLAQVFGLDFGKIRGLIRRAEKRRYDEQGEKRRAEHAENQRIIERRMAQRHETGNKKLCTAQEPARSPFPSRVRLPSFTGFEEEIGWDVNPHNSPRPHAVIEDAPHIKAMALRLSQLPSHAPKPPPRSGQALREDDEELSDAASEGSTVPDSLFSG